MLYFAVRSVQLRYLCSAGVSKLRTEKPFHPARKAILSMMKK